MQKLLRFLRASFIFNLLAELEFKGNFLIKLTLMLAQAVLTVLTLELLFAHTSAIAGWSKTQVLLLMGVARIVEGLAGMLFTKSLGRLPDLIRTGELDMTLMRPLPVQFLVSFRFVRVMDSFQVLLGGFLAVYALSLIGVPVWWWWLLFLWYMGIGLVILYSIYLFVTSCSFWMIRFTTLPAIFDILNKPLKTPITVYNPGVQLFLTFILPLSFVAAVPTQVLLQVVDMKLLFVGALLCLIFLFLSHRFFYFALRRYASASS